MKAAAPAPGCRSHTPYRRADSPGGASIIRRAA